MHRNLSIAFLNIYDTISMLYLSYIFASVYFDSCYKDSDRYILITLVYIIRQTLNNTNISILNKDKTFVSTNNVETYNKEILNDKIHRLTTINV